MAQAACDVERREVAVAHRRDVPAHSEAGPLGVAAGRDEDLIRDIALRLHPIEHVTYTKHCFSVLVNPLRMHRSQLPLRSERHVGVMIDFLDLG